MKEYELYHEYFSACSPKPFTEFSEIETDNLDQYMKQFIPENAECTCEITQDHKIIYDVMSGAIRKRYTFTEI